MELTVKMVILILSATVTSQFAFEEDSTRCKDPAASCVLSTNCMDGYAGNRICDFQDENPLVCCKNVLSSEAPPSLPTTISPRTTTPRTTNLREVLPSDCGKTSLFFNRIVGGEAAKAEDWPWLVLLYINGEPECGGCFISQNWVITAAHCVYSDSAGKRLTDASKIKVRPGATNLTSAATFRGVSRLVPHPSYSGSRNYANDLAIIKLDPEATSERVKPICLPGSPNDFGDPTRQDMTNRRAFVAGWGKTNQDGRDGSDTLMQIQVPVWEDDRCRNAYRRIFRMTNLSFCAGVAQGGKDACQGDSGGPLMLPGFDGRQDRFYAVGLVSFGYGCARPGFPGGYTKTWLYRPWIEQQITLLQ